jgi:hypothetical protein
MFNSSQVEEKKEKEVKEIVEVAAAPESEGKTTLFFVFKIIPFVHFSAYISKGFYKSVKSQPYGIII